MRKSQSVVVLTVGACCSVVALLLLSGCAGTLHPHTDVPIWTTPPAEGSLGAVNPQTGILEMQPLETGTVLLGRAMRGHKGLRLPRAPNAHTNAAGHGQQTDWGFYAVCFLIIGVSYLIISDN